MDSKRHAFTVHTFMSSSQSLQWGITPLFLGALCLILLAPGPVHAQTARAPIAVGINGGTGLGSAGDSGNVVLNPLTNRLYVAGALIGRFDTNGSEDVAGVAVVDLSSNAVTLVQMPTSFSGFWGPQFDDTQGRQSMAINLITNHIYMLGSSYQDMAVMDGATNEVTVVRLPGFNTQDLGGGGIAINPNTNRIYLTGFVPEDGNPAVAVLDGGTNDEIAIYDFPTVYDPRFTPSTCTISPLGGIDVNANTNLVYLSVAGCNRSVAVLDDSIGQLTVLREIALPDSPDCTPDTCLPGFNHFAASWEVAVDSAADRVYLFGSSDRDSVFEIAALDIATGDVDLIPILQFSPTGMTLDGMTDRLYMTGTSPDTNGGLGMLDLSTRAFHVTLLTSFNAGYSANPAIDSAGNRLYAIDNEDGPDGDLLVADLGSSTVPTGSNVFVQADAASITLNSVTTAGSIAVTSIADPATAGQVPGGFAISDLVAYQITPSGSLTFSGSAVTCFQVPVDDSTMFASLRILHEEAGVLVDRTSSQDFSTRTLCATTTSFSPFYVARIGDHVSVQFDQTRAYHAGSTIPIRLRMLSESGTNISSASLTLTARSLTSLGAGTALPVIDSGNANPDSEFRFDPTSPGYIFNLSTKGLAPGRYCLSFWAGSDVAFAYTVVFEVR